MKEILKENKGITLIALVVTIIILIILAGISINLVLGENGIVNRAKAQAEQQKIDRITEKLELEKAPIAIDNKGIIPIDTYLNYIKNEGKGYEITQETRIDANSAYITVDGEYTYLLEQEANGNLKITYQGKLNEVSPTIIDVKVTNTTNTIAVEVEAKNTAEYKYYIKQENGSYEEKAGNETGTYIYEGLEEDTNYLIKIEAINGNKKDEKEIEVTTMPHVHTGSPETGGGCYTVPVYHVHTGSPETGGGCYTEPITETHTHTNACYTTTGFTGTGNSAVMWCGTCGGSYQDHYSRCTCGATQTSRTSYCTCGAHPGINPATHSHRNLTCKKEEGTTTIGYSLGCGKTEESIDSYELGCGK